MFKGINHVGIVVKSIDETLGFLTEAFGAEEIHRVEFPDLKQTSCIVRIGDGQFELMEPLGPDGVVGKFLEAKTKLLSVQSGVEGVRAAIEAAVQARGAARGTGN